MTTVAEYPANIYTTDAILNPYPHYQRMRRLGPAVWLNRHKCFALPRYPECKATLRDDQQFLSDHSVALNALCNRLSRGTTLASDGDEHARRRKLVAHRLLPRALRGVSDAVDDQARSVVEAAVARGTVDGVDLATALPLAVVPDLVGWPRDQREHLLAWGAASFDILGPLNWQAIKALPRAVQMVRFVRRVVAERRVVPGSIVDELLHAADDGVLAHDDCPALMIDYIAPSLDTTISAIPNALYLLGTHPEQWQRLKEDPALIPGAVNEIVRYESPLRAFARRVSCDTEIAGVAIPSGAQVLVMYASANRDEDEWDRAEVFDIGRDAGRHMGFGNGAHACAGQGLARLETTAMLQALLRRVDRIEVVGEPEWAVNNIIRRHRRLPLRLIAA
ncbi:cytochrome P450 [Mycobacterium dioxanotrophicus]|uniref:Cytochrome P450 n=1 Tax=Mycobacterium dioxanotrophicus TaxID=482462 RepID=A0A1Y0C7V5_9MYCO|nr:cytochrome P450 [Mycobacterium dioxanotrophicus]ART71320.1 cytochrome P450 [Mycobacterium dioxanotrophicus]